MQHSVIDLLSASLIPVLAADVSAGAANHIHGALVTVVAAGAFPYKLVIILYDLYLTGEAALLAIVATGIHFGVHDVIVDVADHGDDRRNVMLHVRDLHIADGTAFGECLKVRFKFELGESVDLFCDTHMVAVGDIVLICYTGDDAETLLQAFGKLVGGAFQRRTIDGKADIGFLCPAVAGGVHYFHDGEGKLLCVRIRMGFAGEIVHAFRKSGISEGYGGVAAIEQPVDGFALLKPCQCPVLPEDGSRIRECSLQAVVTAHEGFLTEFQPVSENIPEGTEISTGRECGVHQIDGHHSLIETTVELIIAVLILPRTEC